MKPIPLASLLASRIRKVRFSTKLLLSYIILCTIPVLLVTHIFYQQAKSNIEQSALNLSNLVVLQSNNAINMYMEVIDNTSRSLFTDDIIFYLGQENEHTTLHQIEQHMAVNLKLEHFMTQMPFLQGIMLISSSGKTYTAGLNPSILTRHLLLEQPWYSDISNSKGQLVITPAHTFNSSSERVTMFSAGRLLTDPESRKAGVILFHLSPYNLISSDQYLAEINQKYKPRVILTTSDDQLIFDTLSLDSPAVANDGQAIDANSHFINYNQSVSTGLKVTVVMSKSALFEDIQIYRSLAILISIVILVAIVISSVLLSYQIMKPINRLMTNMKHVRDGFYQPIPNIESAVEFHNLTNTYNLMIMKIKTLIEDVYIAEIKQNESKFIALQNQINPHWLYNTLESIRMKAQLNGNPEVASMIKTLGRLFHMALSKKTESNCIEDELDYISAYLSLQNIRYKNRFRLIVDMPEEVMLTPIIKLIFQPIVENSIVHGFVEHDLHYHITISSKITDDLLCISICDDGAGMTEERLQQLQSLLANPIVRDERQTSIGLTNIQERLQLHYGSSCGLAVKSALDEGTEVMIKIPLSS